MKTAILILLSAIQVSFAQVISTSSPDGKILLKFRLSAEGTAEYSVSYNGDNFLNWSALGVRIKEEAAYNGPMETGTVERNQVDETYPIIAGKSKYAGNYYNQTKLTLNSKRDRNKKLAIYFRIFNDGIAYRYQIINDAKPEVYKVVNENSCFNFSDNYTAWAERKNTFVQNYEGNFNKLSIEDIDKETGPGGVTGKKSPDSLVLMPLTIEISRDLFISVSEAMIDNYPGMYLKKSNFQNSLTSILSPRHDDSSFAALIQTPFMTPWRVIVIGNRPGALIESNIISNLNDPCKIEDVSWIKPGKSTWEWWALNTGFDPGFGWGINDKTYKYYIDFAAKNKIEYITIDAGWYGAIEKVDENDKRNLTATLPQIHLEELVKYAAERNVGIILWAMWYHVRDQMEEAFSFFHKTGIKGLKIDFMNRDDQEMVNFYHDVARTAAKYELLINFHGAYKPDGISRTYPNLITREAVMGNEYSKWSELTSPDYYAILPFTRMIAGPMDYTPGSMRNSKPGENKVNFNSPQTPGTRTAQLAMYVVFDSPLQYLCDSPPVYESAKGFDFIRDVPSAWDSTIVLDGEIGEYIVIARKKGNDWYVGAITNRDAREVTIDFSFLVNNLYSATVYSDNPANYSDVNVSDFKPVKNQERSFSLAPGGGLAIKLKKM